MEFGQQFRNLWRELGSFTCPKAGTWDRLFYFPSEGRHAVDFSSQKNPTASVGSEPTILGTRGQHANHSTTEAAERLLGTSTKFGLKVLTMILTGVIRKWSKYWTFRFYCSKRKNTHTYVLNKSSAYLWAIRNMWTSFPCDINNPSLNHSHNNYEPIGDFAR
jgi:hypothetical protein